MSLIFKAEKLLSKRPFAKKSKNIKWKNFREDAETLKTGEEYAYRLSNAFREYKQLIKNFDSEMQKVKKKGKEGLEDSVKEKFKKRLLKIDKEYEESTKFVYGTTLDDVLNKY